MYLAPASTQLNGQDNLFHPASCISPYTCWLAAICPASLSAEVVMIPGSVPGVRFPRRSGRSSLSLLNVLSASQTHYRIFSQLSIAKEGIQITADTTEDTFPQNMSHKLYPHGEEQDLIRMLKLGSRILFDTQESEENVPMILTGVGAANNRSISSSVLWLLSG